MPNNGKLKALNSLQFIVLLGWLNPSILYTSLLLLFTPGCRSDLIIILNAEKNVASNSLVTLELKIEFFNDNFSDPKTIINY